MFSSKIISGVSDLFRIISLLLYLVSRIVESSVVFSQYDCQSLLLYLVVGHAHYGLGDCSYYGTLCLISSLSQTHFEQNKLYIQPITESDGCEYKFDVIYPVSIATKLGAATAFRTKLIALKIFKFVSRASYGDVCHSFDYLYNSLASHWPKLCD